MDAVGQSYKMFTCFRAQRIGRTRAKPTLTSRRKVEIIFHLYLYSDGRRDCVDVKFIYLLGMCLQTMLRALVVNTGCRLIARIGLPSRGTTRRNWLNMSLREVLNFPTLPSFIVFCLHIALLRSCSRVPSLNIV